MTLQVKGTRGRLKNATVNNRMVDNVYPLLISILRAKKCSVVKARDLKLVLNTCDHWLLTQLGKLLLLLVRLGYAIKLNNARPVKYRLIPKDLWQWIARNCNFQCLNGRITCSLLDICPYHKLLEVSKHG